MTKIANFLLLAFFLPSIASAQMYAPPANGIIPGDSGGTAQNGCILTLLSGSPACSLKTPGQFSSIILNGGTTPTIAGGTGAGASPSLTITGAQNAQLISLTTTCTVSCTGSAVILTVTLPTSCPNQVLPILTPGNINAAQLSASGSVYVTEPSTSSYAINSSSTGLVASTTYKWNVHVDCW